MNHCFDIAHAQKFGVEESIFIQNLAFWIHRNAANEKHQLEGKTWTYNSLQALEILFPYWTAKQIRRVITSLEEQGVILTQQRAAGSVSHTTWYAFQNEHDFLPKKKPIPLAQTGKRTCPNGQAEFPNGQAAINSTDINQIITQIGEGSQEVEFPPNFPKSIEVAIQWAANHPHFPTDFITDTWNKAASRGGRDSNEVAIRNWVPYLAIEWKWHQDRKGRMAQNGGSQFPPSPSLRLRLLEEEIAGHKCNPQSITYRRDTSEADRTAYRSLKEKLRTVKSELVHGTK